MSEVPGKGPELKKSPEKEFQKQIESIAYNRKDITEKAYKMLSLEARFSLTKREITGQPDAEIVFTQDQMEKYFDALGGDKFLENMFEKGKNGLTKEFAKKRKDFEGLRKKIKAIEDAGETYDDLIVTLDNPEAIILFDHAARLHEKKLSQLSFEEFYGDSLEPSSQEIVDKGLTWWENHNKVAREGALKRREAQAETSPAISEQKELEEAYKEIFKQNFAVGEYTLPENTALPKLENKEYKTIGKVDRQWHREKAKVEAWYRVKAENAQRMLSVFDQVEHNFASLQDPKVLEAYKGLLTKMSTMTSFKAKDWKKLVSESGLTKAQIYGPEGIYNLLLAFQRASVTVPKNKEGSTITYRLLGSRKDRSTRLMEKLGPKMQELPKEARVDRLETTPVPKTPEKTEEPVKIEGEPMTKAEFLLSQELEHALAAEGLSMVRQTTGYIKAGEAEINCEYSISKSDGGLPYPLTTKEGGKMYLYNLKEATETTPSRFIRLGEMPFGKGKEAAKAFAKKAKELIK